MIKLSRNIIVMIGSTIVFFVQVLPFITGHANLPDLLRASTNETKEGKHPSNIKEPPNKIKESPIKSISPPENKHAPKPNPISNQKIVEVIVPICGNYPKATVYNAEDNKRLGKTPYKIQAPIGSHLKFVLKSMNYKSKNIDLIVRSIGNNRCHSLDKEK